MPGIDLSGQEFGRWRVLERAPDAPRHQWRWLCQCSCGVRKIVRASCLRSGQSRSCGCLNREAAGNRARTHGQSKTRLYKVWMGMRNRCELASNIGYRWYGGRGITVCPEWKEFQAFAAWAKASGYRAGLTIDRIDNDKGYSPDNCRWASRVEQNRNQRSTKLTAADAETIREMARSGQSQRAIARKVGISRSYAQAIISGKNWAPDGGAGHRRFERLERRHNGRAK